MQKFVSCTKLWKQIGVLKTMGDFLPLLIILSVQKLCEKSWIHLVISSDAPISECNLMTRDSGKKAPEAVLDALLNHTDTLANWTHPLRWCKMPYSITLIHWQIELTHWRGVRWLTQSHRYAGKLNSPTEGVLDALLNHTDTLANWTHPLKGC